MARKKNTDKPIPKNMSETTFDALVGMTSEDLKSVVVASTVQAAELKLLRDNDQGYIDTKQAYKDVAGSFNDTIKAEKAKAEFAIDVLKGRGVSLSREDLIKVATPASSAATA